MTLKVKAQYKCTKLHLSKYAYAQFTARTSSSQIPNNNYRCSGPGLGTS